MVIVEEEDLEKDAHVPALAGAHITDIHRARNVKELWG